MLRVDLISVKVLELSRAWFSNPILLWEARPRLFETRLNCDVALG